MLIRGHCSTDSGDSSELPGDQVGEVTSLQLDQAVSPVAKEGHWMLSTEELNLGVLLLSFRL